MRRFPWLLCCLIITGSLYASDPPAGEKKPGFFSRALNSVNIFRKKDSDRAASVRTKSLDVTMEITPSTFSLADTRQLKVSLFLKNRSKRLVQLEFPTSQRIEVLVRDAYGKLITQWSEDQAFANVATYVAINPGEKLQYDANIPTREMSAGKTYTIEAFLPNYEEIKVQRNIVPRE
jgi:hypothetical protein